MTPDKRTHCSTDTTEPAMAGRPTCEQHVWDCRWARVAAVQTPLRRGNPTLSMMWACDRERSRRRSVNDDECARCLRWERDGLPTN